MTAPLELIVPGRLVNPLNVSRFGLWKHRRWAKNARERTAEAVRVALLTTPSWRTIPPSALKVVTFTLIGPRARDDDSWAACVKPHRDGLIDGGLIHGDAPRDGHRFVYAQEVARKRPAALVIRVEMAP